VIARVSQLSGCRESLERVISGRGTLHRYIIISDNLGLQGE